MQRIWREAKSTTTPVRDDLNCDPKSALSEYCCSPQNAEFTLLLFPFDPAGKKRDFQVEENKKHKPYDNTVFFE